MEGTVQYRCHEYRLSPTHRSLMGDAPEAIEGQARLFRVLVAYAIYNPWIGYSQEFSTMPKYFNSYLNTECFDFVNILSKHSVLVPAQCRSEVHKWETDCMQSLVLEEEEEEPVPGKGRKQGSLKRKKSKKEKRNLGLTG
ncbi:UNVERIFIED_CONTAM: hypothetical protein FKN15_019766 [Acipenser sinensis]